MAEDFGGDSALGPLYHAVVAAAGMLEDYAIGINYARLEDQGVAGEIRAAWDDIMVQVGRIQQQLVALPDGARAPEGREDGDG